MISFAGEKHLNFRTQKDGLHLADRRRMKNRLCGNSAEAGICLYLLIS